MKSCLIGSSLGFETKLYIHISACKLFLFILKFKWTLLSFYIRPLESSGVLLALVVRGDGHRSRRRSSCALGCVRDQAEAEGDALRVGGDEAFTVFSIQWPQCFSFQDSDCRDVNATIKLN